MTLTQDEMRAHRTLWADGDFKVVAPVAAHLPGQHDQSTHGHRGGGGWSSDSVEDWSTISGFHKGPLKLRGWHVRDPGSSADLSDESKEALGREDFLGPGFYIGTRESTEMYGDAMPVEISFENPYVMWSPSEDGWAIQDPDELEEIFGSLPGGDYDGIVIPVASIFGVDEAQAVLRPGNSDKIRFLSIVQAHGGGSHDQRSHNPHKGSGGAALVMRRAVTPEERIAKAEAVEALYTFTHSESGMRTEPQVREVGQPGAIVYGEILDKDGEKVGSFSRRILEDRLGYGEEEQAVTIQHLDLHIDEGHRGQGFATEFNAHAEAGYRELSPGPKTIELQAAEVGRYAWAKAGYDFKDPELEAPRYVNALHEQLVDDQLGLITGRWAMSLEPGGNRAGIPTPLDIAMLGYTPGADMWPGKQALLDLEGWEGVKRLD